MSHDGHQVAILTAELTVAQRADVIQRFRDGKEKVLIATNVCARGNPGKPPTPFALPAAVKRASGPPLLLVAPWARATDPSPTCGAR